MYHSYFNKEEHVGGMMHAQVKETTSEPDGNYLQ